MTRLPRVKGRELFGLSRRRASRSAGLAGATFSSNTSMAELPQFPVHSGETLGPGLLRAILRDVELSVEELVELL
jgi:hypothetical protein